MNPHLDAALCAKYPEIMKERNLGAMQTAMCWGFDHGDGWYHILESAMRLVQSHIDMHNRKGASIEPVVFEQVKEKFGGLRFYYEGGDEYCSGAMAMAEVMSGKICEVCGMRGIRRGKGWIRTLCNEHGKNED